MKQILVGFVLLVVTSCAFGAASQVIWPAYTTATDGVFQVANRLYCTRAPITVDAIVNTMAVAYPGSNSGICGAAYYFDDDAGAQIAAISTTCPSLGGVLTTGNIGAIGLAAGQVYRGCVCASIANTSYLGMVSPSLGGNFFVPTLLDAGPVVQTGFAANPCVAGVPPATTGSITSDNTMIVPLVLWDTAP